MHVFHRYNDTVSHHSPDWVVLPSSNYSYSLASSQFLSRYNHRSQSFSMRYPFPFSCPQLFTTLCSYLTPPSLSVSVSHGLQFFLFFCLLPPLVFLGMSRHVQESREREERGRTLVAVSNFTADRWEALPGVKVQSQGNTTPQALVLGDLVS